MTGRPFQVTVTERREQLEKSLRHARSASQKEGYRDLIVSEFRDPSDLSNHLGSPQSMPKTASRS